ncbi:formate--tetrahydrofolate ligase [Nesterenkonia marinintestina]|uniref:formate--tetrahydrofolate ligase n=1 Tax=Nesterenkonia marinintestina TaxID=2979865 RepID=UPI0021C0B5AA|nr:formate--tetrahydrofolate ligase [Nesterenkonia sp. GX14115]
MSHLSDIEIASAADLRPIGDVAHDLGLSDEALYPIGHHMAKIDAEQLRERPQSGRVVLVTALTPTPAGEGKSTMTVGLTDGLNRIGVRAAAALREPSLGPVFGMKGGATGGGYAQVVPMEDINLHFTGDFHAITSANNLLAASIDNHIQQGNALGIDPRRIDFRRVLDMNDRALRQIVVGLGGPAQGVPREDQFTITVASEVMAVLCLATDLEDLKARLGRITVASTYDRRPVTVADIGVAGAMTVLLKRAVQPNLVQTLEGNPALIHGGPFANVAHGCSSVRATQTARRLADVVVTEAGFGADLGAEKFLDIKAPQADCYPDAVVLVATVRALKMHGGVAKDDLRTEDVDALRRGLANLDRHVTNMRGAGAEPVIAINAFVHDTDAEVEALRSWCVEQGLRSAVVEAWARGGAGAVDLAEQVSRALEQPAEMQSFYAADMTLEEKIRTLVTEVYRGDGAEFSSVARRKLAEYERQGWDRLPVCVAKTQYSFSDDPSLRGAPEGFTLTVRDLQVRTGAGFVVVLTGDIMTMPGLPKHPAALDMDITADGGVSGLS